MKLGYNWRSGFKGAVVGYSGRTTTADDGACLYYRLPRSFRLRRAKILENASSPAPMALWPRNLVCNIDH